CGVAISGQLPTIVSGHGRAKSKWRRLRTLNHVMGGDIGVQEVD
ncbi:hypothetical protein L915_16437, partial [Phytophthora nicotianae]